MNKSIELHFKTISVVLICLFAFFALVYMAIFAPVFLFIILGLIALAVVYDEVYKHIKIQDE